MIELMLAAALAQAQPPAQPTPAPGPDWQHVANTDSGEAWVDPASVRRTGDTFEIVERVVFNQARPDGTKTGTVRIWFDCARRLVALRHFRSLDAGGALVDEADAVGPASQPHGGGEGTVYATIMELYCPPQATAS